MARARLMAAALLAALFTSLAWAADAWVWRLPPGMPEPEVPADNPMSEPRRALGERLFFESKLSVTGGMSCADCHEPQHAFTDARARSPGATGELTDRGAMSLVNAAYGLSLGWVKPEVRRLEDQMREPLLNTHPVEMGLAGREAAVLAMLASRSDYRAQFRAAFPGEAQPVSLENVIKAIACYERTLIYADSPFDRVLYRGEHGAMSAAARRGQDLFFSDAVGCAKCHDGILLAGPWRDARGATGSPALADNGLGAGRFKVPTLRNIALTAPYMHDGRFADLAAVVAHYSAQGAADARARKDLDTRLPARPLAAAEQQDLRAFLDALTDTAFRR